ncbi:phytanoyl-CoA dioxygenase family protein [Paenibacillus contaminans]|uniref:Phytanoyl-CoA dioxygenase family protein n=1 Tax=Paenibacillus contaminans TaxID=450362 RepID=A0A329MJP8_9BACL|nr:phytanoyl-CoA dioxygenase family protein [Paenibacillus contaminans]RAV18963.1 phytanoyl-CoA dioxygenase family protein [Paenibacillus contaminans]
MSKQHTLATLTEEQKQQFDRDGYLIIKGLFNEREIETMKETFMNMHAQGSIPGCFTSVPLEESNGDMLKVYPRMMHPHRVSETAKGYMIHPQVMDVLADLFEEEAYAAQSMFYFKPPGARGQALHQDNFYLKVEPGTCIAAWTAVDPSDEENGGIMLVPRTNTISIECPHQADPAVSFSKEEVNVPEGMQVVATKLEAGDVLFFNGSIIHGSYPNQSSDRFRRSFICHYTGVSTDKIGRYYNPLYTRDGEAVDMTWNEEAGPCGNEFPEAMGPH